MKAGKIVAIAMLATFAFGTAANAQHKRVVVKHHHVKKVKKHHKGH